MDRKASHLYDADKCFSPLKRSFKYAVLQNVLCSVCQGKQALLSTASVQVTLQCIIEAMH